MGPRPHETDTQWDQTAQATAPGCGLKRAALARGTCLGLLHRRARHHRVCAPRGQHREGKEVKGAIEGAAQLGGEAAAQE